MSDEARKNCRTQGRFSDGKGPKSKDKKHRNSYGAKVSPEGQYSRKNPDDKSANSTLTDENISPLKYEENSDYSFEQLEKVEKPEEIKGRGDIILSRTRHGESRIFFEPQFLPDEKSDHFFNEILDTIHWDTRNIIIHGVEYPQPRLVAWFGPFPYSYSGTTLEAAEMPDIVLEVKKEVESCLAHNGIEATFNSVLINLYRDGKDSVAWHSDDEIMLGFSPTIASVSLGETRKFELRSKIRNYDDQSPSNRPIQYFVNLTHGSLIVMTGCMQEDWQHRIPKEYHDKKERINLTFRTVYPLEKVIHLKRQRRSFQRKSWNRTPRKKLRLANFASTSRSADVNDEIQAFNNSMSNDFNTENISFGKRKSLHDVSVDHTDSYSEDINKSNDEIRALNFSMSSGNSSKNVSFDEKKSMHDLSVDHTDSYSEDIDKSNVEIRAYNCNMSRSSSSKNVSFDGKKSMHDQSADHTDSYSENIDKSNDEIQAFNYNVSSGNSSKNVSFDEKKSMHDVSVDHTDSYSEDIDKSNDEIRAFNNSMSSGNSSKNVSFDEKKSMHDQSADHTDSYSEDIDKSNAEIQALNYNMLRSNSSKNASLSGDLGMDEKKSYE